MTDATVVMITGAARRIGACLARRFHERGYRVLIHCHRSLDEAHALADDLQQQRPDSARVLSADLTDAAQVESLGEQALASYGRLDVLVNNASSFYSGEIGQLDQAHWDDLVDSNLRAAFFLSQALAPAIARQHGSIINIVDTHADNPLPGYPVYSIAKAGLKAMTKSLAKELAPDIRVNGVSPGAILWPPPLADDHDPEVQAKRKAALQRIPLGRLGDPDAIAAATLFLTEDASYITGQVIKVDGGRSLL